MKLILPKRALLRFDDAMAEMEAEDQKPFRSRDSRVYARGYAIVETYGLLLGLHDTSDLDAIREVVRISTEHGVEVEQ